MRKRIGFAGILLCLVCHGQQSLETKYRTSGQTVVDAFEAQRAVLQSSSAVIMDGRTEALYGVVVSPQGHILTKASDFEALKKPEIIIGKKRYEEAKVLATDSIWDVVLLHCGAGETQPVEYDESELEHGTWIVVNGASSRFRRRALVGIVSANAREIPVKGGAALGVLLKPDSEPPTVEKVQEGSGAEKAGLKEGDRILRLADKEIANFEDIKKAMEGRKAGEILEVEVERDENFLEVKRIEKVGEEINLEHREKAKKMVKLTMQVELSSKAEMFRPAGMMDRNDMMSGDFSKRRSGFPRVLQHDVLANSTTMGGPVLNLDGKCVGMNIARANRAETFAIPAKELKELAARLMREAAE